MELLEDRNTPATFTWSLSPSLLDARIYVKEALLIWTSVAQLNFIEVEEQADIALSAQYLDGFGGVLGLGGSGVVIIDTGENWSPVGFEAGYNLPVVLAHEIGHTLGLLHDPLPGSLMSTHYSNGLLTLSDYDIQNIQTAYGAGSGSVSSLADTASPEWHAVWDSAIWSNLTYCIHMTSVYKAGV